MPASTLDAVSTALRTVLSKKEEENRDLDLQLAGTAKKALLENIEFEQAGNYQTNVLDVLKTKYIVLKSPEVTQKCNSKPEEGPKEEETLQPAKQELYPLEAIQLGWSGINDWSVGAGMVNMGNTCYLNSTLQALFHVPSLVNWLMSDKEHTAQCQYSGSLCIICAMRKTLQESQQRNVSSIRPILIYNKLRLVCRNLIPGRQEDAHEFLRYLVEAMEKSYLQRFKSYMEFDSKVKETTPLNQILGGYLRSAVQCLRCRHVSTTFQHFQDLLLDIRKAQTLGEALELYFSREKLDDESYHCESCQKKVPATKQFSLERAPMVLCIQLKRFSVSNNKITKHVAFKQRLDLSSFSRQQPSAPLIYRLVAIVTHMGPTVSCGHYTAVAQAPSGNFYQFDDSTVRPISHQAVFNTNAYIMLYELESTPQKPVVRNNISSTVIEPTTSAPLKLEHPEVHPMPAKIPNGIGFTSDKVYGPELPPDRLNCNSTAPATSSALNGKKHAVSSSSHTDESTTNSSDSSEEEAPPSPTVKEPDSSTPNDPQMSLREASPLAEPSNSEATTAAPKKSKSLVPYDTGDTSSSEDSNHSESREVTKATVGEWQVTSSTDVTRKEPSSESEGWDKKRAVETSSGSVVSELYKMSTSAYSAPVFSWNGSRSQFDKDAGNERREDRKRLMADSSDQGRVKHQKVTSSYGNGKSNPGYNPVQEYHNMKNWGNGSPGGHGHHYKPFYNGNRHRRSFHHKGNFHKNNYRFR